MIIKRLQIDSFGKFENKTLDFSDGINIISGENESGKTTAQQFIINALYGFFRRDVKGRRVLASYDRYRPWNNPNRFSGRITLKNGENEYTIIRNLIKTNPKVTVLNSAGTEITEDFEFNSGMKCCDPAPQITGLSRTAFENTLCVSQHDCAAVSTLGEELSEKLSSISQSADADISAVTAAAYLDKKLSEIGTERKNSPYKTLCTKISELEEELAEAQEAKATFFALKDTKEELEAEKKRLKDKVSELEAKTAAFRNNAELKRFSRVQKIETEIKLIKKNIQELEQYANIDPAKVTDAFGKLEALKNLKSADEKQRLRLNEMKNEKSSAVSALENCGLKSVDSALLGEFSQNRAEVRQYFEISNEIKELEQELNRNKSGSSFDAIINEYDKLCGEKNKISDGIKQKKKLLITSFAIVLVGIILSFIKLPLIFTAVLGLIPAFFALKINTDTAETDRKISKLLTENSLPKDCTRDDLISFSAHENSRRELLSARINARKSELKILENRLDAYFSILTGMNWETQIKEISDCVKNAVQLIGQIDELKIKIRTAEETVKDSSSSAEKLQSEIAGIFNLYGVVNSDGLNICREKKVKYDELRREYSALEQEFSRLLDGENIDAFAEKCKNIEFTETKENEDEINEALASARSESESCAERLSAVTERLNAVAESTRTVGEISIELLFNRRELQKLDEQRGALTAAKERIKSISREIHSEFAPHLNRSISECADFISDGKYKALRLTSDFNLYADTSECAEPVPAGFLSGGTADMVYLAARIALTDFLAGDGEPLPMIFDDSFVFLDRSRLEKFLEFIAESGRQILIFTCHSRECDILRAKNIPFSEIKL